MEDRAGGDRFLVVAAGAFVNARTLLQLPCLTAAAPRTDVAARPPQAGQVFEALFLGAEARHEFEEPVHPILRHHPTGMLPQREQLCKNIRRTCFSWIGRRRYHRTIGERTGRTRAAAPSCGRSCRDLTVLFARRRSVARAFRWDRPRL